MKKVVLYLNTLSYLSLTQIYFLVYNKFIKKYLFEFFLFINNKKLISNKKNDFPKIRNTINKIFGEQNIWSLGIDKLEQHSNYFEDLKSNIICFLEFDDIKAIKTLWINKVDDVELNFNYQRFYLFKEVFDDINLSDKRQVSLILEWIILNKKNQLAWSGFNCAMRLVNWMKILKDIDKDEIKVEQWNVIENSIYQQYLFNCNNIDYHIPSNHIALQYYSVWLIVNIFSNWNESEQAKKRKKEILLKEFEVEFSSDGLHFELSTHYHLQIVLLGLTVIHQLDNLGETIPLNFIDLVSKATSVSDKFIIGNYFPTIGDGCYNFFHENKKQDLQNIKYLRNKYLTKDDERISHALIDNSYLFIEDNLFKIIFDVGNISLKSTPGHGHADLLSIILGYNEIPIFIDPGTYQYKNTEASLKLKKTFFHNTVSIGQEDQAKLWGFFRWAYLPKKIKSNFNTLSEDIKIVVGEFLGYRHIGGIIHERSISVDVNKVRIKDSLKGRLDHNIQINFILHPEILVEQKNNIVFLKSKLNNFKLKCSNENILSSVEGIFIYDSYNTATASKKISFNINNHSESKFDSEILFEVLN